MKRQGRKVQCVCVCVQESVCIITDKQTGKCAQLPLCN